jgi:hypothetical protein
MASISTLLSRSRRRSTFDREFDSSVLPPVQSVPTFLGWTPGLRSLVSGRVLPCGCLVGIYEARGGYLVEILDARGDGCTDRTHICNAVGFSEH